MTPGEIRCREAYAQGKMLNNGGWSGVLPRGITPSDIDLVFDDAKRGRVCLCELSSQYRTWRDVPAGQRLLYKHCVATGSGRVIAVLLTHSVDPNLGRDIDTRNDIDSFQVMRFAPLLKWTTGAIQCGTDWPDFVERFYCGEVL